MANDGFIEFLSPNALAELKKASEIVDALALKIEKISNFKAPTTPGGVNSASKQIIDDLKAQEAQLKAINAELIREEKLKQQVLATEAKQANATKANIAQREAQRKASLAQQQSDEKAARAAERSALANQRLNDAYGQLNKRRNEAARVLQNLIASETASNAEIRKAQREFDILNGKVKKADQAVGNFSRNVGNYKSALSGVSQLMSAFGISTGVFLAVDIAKSIFNTTKELQSLDMALRNVSGTQLIYQENMNFLSKVSEDFGIEIKGLQEQFTQFYVAAKDKLSAEQIRDIFKSISKAGAAMGLSVEAQNSAFLALQQMMSKGTVQAEELKKQLGNALPGAFNIMATALGVTEKKMMEMMKAGNILSEVALPKFAKALEKAYGIQNVERIDTIIAAQERLSNSWTNLIRGITEGDGVINKVLIKTLNLWTYSLNGVIYATNVLSQATKKLFGIEETDKIKKSKAVKQAISDYEEMQSALKKANEEREKEVVRLNKLQKIQGNVTETEKTKAQFEASISEEKIRKLDILIEKETKLLNIKKVDTVKKLNEEIAALQARNAETSLFSLEAIRKRDKLIPQSEEWLSLNKYIKDNNKIVQENNAKLIYNYNLRELILRKDKVRTPTELDTETGTSGNKRQRAIKSQKDKIYLNFEEAKSEYELKRAILERQRAGFSDIMNDEEKQLDTRLKARLDFSNESIQIIDLEAKHELAVAELKLKDAYEKNNKALVDGLKNNKYNNQNKLISDAAYNAENTRLYQQHADNVADIDTTANNERQLATTLILNKIQELQRQDYDFNQKIAERKLGFTQDALKTTLAGQIKYHETIKDNEEILLQIRENSFQEWLKLKKKEIEVQEQIDLSNATSAEETNAIMVKYFNMYQDLNLIQSPFVQARRDFEDFIDSLSSGAIDKALGDLGLSSAKLFLDFKRQFGADGVTVVGFKSSFELMYDNAKTFGEKFAVIFQGVGDVFQETMNLINQGQEQRFANEYARLEKEKEIALAFAGDTASAKANIEEQYEERKRAIANKEAQAKKKQAIFNIAIDTAQAVVATLAKTPPPAGLPLAALVAILGGIQIALVNSQEVPQFYKGTDNAPEGIAWTQEKGREIIADKSGKIKSYGSDKGAQLTYLNKGDKVFTAEKSAMMFNENLNSILTSNGIDMPKIQINNQAITDAQINRIVDTINDKEGVQIYNDGINIIMKRKKANQLVEIANRRISFIGKSI